MVGTAEVTDIKTRKVMTVPAVSRYSKKQVKRITRKVNKARASRALNKVFNGFTSKSPFPPVKAYKLKYSGVHIMSVGAVGVLGTIQKYNLNSLFDCDNTGGGHQPYGFDALAVPYNRYKVNGVRVTIKIDDPSIDAMAINWLLTNPSNASETIAGLSPYQVKEKTMGGGFTINNSGSQHRQVSFYLPMWKVAGVTALQFKADPDNYTGPVTADPGNLCQLQLAIADLRGGSSGTCLFQIELTYYATLYQRKVMATS